MSFVPESAVIQGISLIANLSPELKLVGDCLSNQLDDLKVLLAQRELFIQNEVKEEYRTVIENFLGVIGKYVGGTLMELLKIIRDLSNLVEIYDRELPIFILRAASTQEGIDVCIDEIRIKPSGTLRPTRRWSNF